MANKDYYEILGISRNASDDAIKKAFRKKAHEHHPDKTGGDDQKFKEINEAYQVLSNKQKKAQYDQFGQSFEGSQYGDSSGFEGFNQTGGQGFGGFEDMFKNGFSQGAGGFNVNMEDLFDDFFSGSGYKTSRRGRQKREETVEDLIVNVVLSFQEAALGCNKEIVYDRKIQCSHCHGEGAEPGSTVKKCSTCNGAGQVKDTQRTFLGFFTQVKVCPDCQGEGRRAEKKCQECNGKGIEEHEEHLDVKIPAGVRSGEALRLRDKGHETAKGGSSDLYLQITVNEDPIFERKENDIILIKEITYSQAALGAKIEVPTLYGDVEIKIPSGTQSGDVFRLRDKGIVSSRLSKGDQLIKIQIITPTKLTRKAKEYLKGLENEGY